jgi:hypothetical protein
MAYVKQFASEDVRLRTFFRFKGDQHIVKALVDCGFFLENDDKRVCCFHCGIGFEADSTLHDFRAIHLKASPHCTFLNSIISQRERRKLMRQIKYYKPATYFVRQPAPFNDEYIDCYNRALTLPENVSIRTARAGFYFSEQAYFCYECGVSASHFFESPWKQHAALNPNCIHLLRSKGFYFIQKNV